jgi:hypothetical protein
MSDRADCPSEELEAMLHALGALSPQQRAALERRRPDAALDALIASWEQRLTEIAIEAAPQIAPPAEVWDRIEAALDRPAQAVEELRVIRFDQAVWEPWSEGLAIKVLTRDRSGAPSGFLMRMEPGAVVPEHVHDCIEECLIVEGDLLHDGRLLTSGDFTIGRAGGLHTPMTSPSGGLLYVRYLAA